MKKKNNIVLPVPFKLYIYLAKRKNEENLKRVKNNQKEYSLSSYCNYVIKTTLEQFLDLNDFSVGFVNSRSSSISEYKITKVSKRKINIGLDSYNEYLIKSILMDNNSMSFNENLKCVLNLFYYLEEGEIVF